MLRNLKNILVPCKIYSSIRNASLSPTIRLNNDICIPMVGLGTFKGFNSPGDQIVEAVRCAIDVGYRHIDCAFLYGNEKEIGQAVKEKIQEGVIKREDIFITSKLWNTYHSPDLVPNALCATLKNFGMSYVDLYLVHWPMGYEEGGDLFPKDCHGNIKFSDVDYVETWRAMENMVTEGLTKSIGVSNFTIEQLKRVLDCAKIVPAVNQIECHPYLPQKKLSNFCACNDIVVVAYSPLGSPSNPWKKASDDDLMKDKVVQEMAKKMSKTPAQILIRYQLERGHVTIPKSETPKRIVTNFDVLDFKLSTSDVEKLNALDRKGSIRYFNFEEAKKHKYYPFK